MADRLLQPPTRWLMSEAIEKILVPADGSEESESAFAAILPVVKAYAPEVTVLHVFEDPDASYLSLIHI